MLRLTESPRQQRNALRSESSTHRHVKLHTPGHFHEFRRGWGETQEGDSVTGTQPGCTGIGSTSSKDTRTGQTIVCISPHRTVTSFSLKGGTLLRGKGVYL